MRQSIEMAENQGQLSAESIIMHNIIQFAEVSDTQQSESLIKMNDNMESSEGPDELKLPQ